MAKTSDRAAAAEIQQLLEERKRLEQWLMRLGKAADRTPEAVRARVRDDYQSRLDTVVTQLQGYEGDLRESLTDVQSRHEAARKQERLATEELAEAELRFAVGEFEDDEWTQKKATILDRLIGIREEMGQSEEEIGELEEVLSSITAPSTASSVAEREAPSSAEPEIAELEDEPEEEAPTPTKPAAPSRLSLGSDLGLRDLPTEKSSPPARPRPRPKPKPEPMGDEMEFLKALGDEGGKARAAKPERAPARPKAVESLSEPANVRSRPSVINQRTLKCGECGAMNLPTEWYCDRCGAELASL